jgi:GrpB-like predicted nucleotidyltransferase (UPF0157 family)
MYKNLNQRVIEIIDYDPIWISYFLVEKDLLTNVIGCNLVSIEHVGSTSIKGLAAKPIIDILIEVTNITELDSVSEDLESLGYVVKGENGISGRRYFQKGGLEHSHHLHAFQTKDANLMRHRAFKEYLIAHPIASAAYGHIKKDAVNNCNNDIKAYMKLKNDFIQHHEKLAIEWFKSSNIVNV